MNAIEPSIAEPAAEGRPLRRRLMIAASGLVMAGLMLVGTFSIGVWVGAGRPETTATFGGFGGNGGGPPGGFGGNGGGPPAGLGGFQPPGGQGQNGAATFDSLSGPADIIGQIVSVSGNSLAVSSQAGQRVVTLTSETKIFTSDGEAGSRADLQRGRLVGIVGTAANGGLSFSADEIEVVTGQ
jgi:hypothetical protein